MTIISWHCVWYWWFNFSVGLLFFKVIKSIKLKLNALFNSEILISRSVNLKGHLISMAFCPWAIPSGHPIHGHFEFTIKPHVETFLLNKVSYLLMTLLSFSNSHFVASFVNFYSHICIFFLVFFLNWQLI